MSNVEVVVTSGSGRITVSQRGASTVDAIPTRADSFNTTTAGPRGPIGPMGPAGPKGDTGSINTSDPLTLSNNLTVNGGIAIGGVAQSNVRLSAYALGGSVVPIVANSAADQQVDMQQWRNYNNDPMAFINRHGGATFSGPPNNNLSTPALRLYYGASGSGAMLIEGYNHGGQMVFRVGRDGDIHGDALYANTLQANNFTAGADMYINTQATASGVKIGHPEGPLAALAVTAKQFNFDALTITGVPNANGPQTGSLTRWMRHIDGTDVARMSATGNLYVADGVTLKSPNNSLYSVGVDDNGILTGVAAGAVSTFANTFFDGDVVPGPYAGNFQLLNFNKVSDPGNNFSTGSMMYTVPSTGLYFMLGRLRVPDNVGQTAYGMGIHSAGDDGPWFQWNQIPGIGSRSTMNYQRMAYFTAGQQIRMFTYESQTFIAGAMQIIRIA